MLTEFRRRLLQGEAEQRLLDRLLAGLREAGYVRAKGMQRTDATHVRSAVRDLTRLELIGETLRAALNALARLDPGWVAGITHPV